METSVDGFAGTRGGADCGGRERAEGGAGAERRAVERGEVDAKAAGDGQRRAWQDWRPCAAEDRGTHRAWLVARTAAAFILRGLVIELAGRGLRVDYRTVWKFIRREGLSFKKNRAGERAKPSRRRPQARAVEDPPGAALIRGGWSSSMKPGPRRIWGRCAGGLRAVSACRDRFPTDTGRP